MGAFHSRLKTHESHAELYLGVDAQGLGRRVVYANPPLDTEASSGELRLTWRGASGPQRHRAALNVRGREVVSTYGGAATIDYGTTSIQDPPSRPKPLTRPSATMIEDHVQQWWVGGYYAWLLPDVAELAVGVQKTHYQKTVSTRSGGRDRGRRSTLALQSTAAWTVSPRMVLYAGYTTGLEESGTAPDNAVNRNAPLPAARTRQADVGVRARLGANSRHVVGGFRVEKPYFDLGPDGVFQRLGEERHKGVEISLSTQIASQLNILLGGVFMSPEVVGDGGAAGSRTPIGQTDRFVRLNVEYRPKSHPALSVDLALTHAGERHVDGLGRLRLPERTLLDSGLRYRLKAGNNPAVLRLQVLNVTNAGGWKVIAGGALQRQEPRRFAAQLVVDF